MNQLEPGSLRRPDATRPRVLRIGVRSVAGRDGPARRLSGRLFFVVEAVDTPALPVQGRWHGGYPVTLSPDHVEDPTGEPDRRARAGGLGRTPVGAEERAILGRLRSRTYQNWPVFDSQHHRFERGKLLFKLPARPFDTRRLADGEYELVVTAEDTGGNRDVGRLRFTTDNSSV